MHFTTSSVSSILGGAGSALHPAVLSFAGACTLFATLLSSMSIYLQLKNYRKPLLQRMVIRIMLMVPIYGIASFISIFSLEAATIIDALRDIYEAFVIYCFFNLLLGYLGGERSLLILLHGREPKAAVFPISLFKKEFDVSDPYTFLFLKRGILQYVQVKPILALATLIFKAVGKFNEGDLRSDSGYLYISIVYNISIFLSLYCLAMFWLCVNDDLTPFRPVPKFLCVKGILFFSFWQSFAISILVKAGAIKQLGPYTDSEHISLGLTDTLICFEMPLFAMAHLYAFSHTDYIDHNIMYAARMPMYYAIRDAFGFKDVVEDTKATLRGEGMDYREFEPAEGFIHQGSGRDRRIKAGLRYSKGGKNKYWLPMPAERTQLGASQSNVKKAIDRTGIHGEEDEVYAPLFEDQPDSIVHMAPDLRTARYNNAQADGEGLELPFGDPDEEDDHLFTHSKQYLFGDYNYPCIDVSSEFARRTIWDEEERILRHERGAYFSPLTGQKGLFFKSQDSRVSNYGSISTSNAISNSAAHKGKYRDDGSDGPDVQQVTGRERLIDFDDNRIPGAVEGVKLSWTNRGGLSPKQSTPSSLASSRRPSKNGHDGRGSPSLKAPAPHGTISRNTQVLSSPSSSTRDSEPPRKEIRTDAVDLVVEDPVTAEEEMGRERMKGEPAIRGSGFRKIYHRGYFDAKNRDEPEEFIQAAQGDAAAELDDDYVPSRRTLFRIASEGDEDAFSTPSETVIESMRAPVATAATPPPQIQVEVDEFRQAHEENPWA